MELGLFRGTRKRLIAMTTTTHLPGSTSFLGKTRKSRPSKMWNKMYMDIIWITLIITMKWKKSDPKKYRNIVGIVWFFSPALYWGLLSQFGVTDNWAWIIASVLWMISAFPMAKIINFIR